MATFHAGMVATVASSALGGMAALGIRFALGFLFLLAVALALRCNGRRGATGSPSRRLVCSSMASFSSSMPSRGRAAWARSAECAQVARCFHRDGGVAIALAAASSIGSFGAAEWAAALYLGAFGGALAFYVWVYALQRTTPTRMANTITVSPIAAALLAAVLMGEPIGWSLMLGIAAVAAGIWIASTGS